MHTNRRRIMTAALGATVLPAAAWALRGGDAFGQPASPAAAKPQVPELPPLDTSIDLTPRTTLLRPRSRDITADLEAALAAKPQEIVIPSGEWGISRTIKLSQREHGLTIRGPERMATLQWAGPRGGLMFHVSALTRLRFEKLTLRGQGKGAGDTLVLLRNNDKYGTAHVIMREVMLEKAGTGVQFGDDHKENMCSDCIFDFCKVWMCKKGFWVRNSQGLNYFCSALYLFFTDTGWHLERGGLLLVDGAQIGFCKTFLRVDGGEINVGVAATLNNVRSEGRVGEQKGNVRYRLVEAVASAGCVVNVNGYAVAHSVDRQGDTDFLVGPGNHVNVTGSTFNRPPRIATLQGTAERPASLLMQGCLFYAGLNKESFEVKGPKDAATLRDCRTLNRIVNRTLTRQGAGALPDSAE